MTSSFRRIGAPLGRVARPLALALAVYAALPTGNAVAASDDGQSGASAGVQPSLGVPVDQLHLLGTTGDQTWGYGFLRDVPANLGGIRVPASQVTDPNARATAFVVYRPGTGWQIVGEAQNADATAAPHFLPATLPTSADAPFGDGSMAASGAAALLGNITTDTADSSAESNPVLAIRNPDGPFVLAPSPAANAPANLNAFTTPVAPVVAAGVGEARSLLESATPTTDLTTSGQAEPALAQRQSGGAEVAGTTPSTSATPPSSPESTGPTATPTPSGAPEPSTPAAVSVAASTPPAADPSAEPVFGAAAATTPSATTPPTTPPAPTIPTTPLVPDPTGGNATGRAGASAQLTATEHLFSGARRIVMAVDESRGRAGALVGVVNDSGVETSVLHYDGSIWTREQVVLTTSLKKGNFRLLALSGTGLSDAWLLGQASTESGAGLVLFHRDADAIWRLRTLGTSLYASAGPKSTGATLLGPLAQPAQALTATSDGVWIDGSFSIKGTVYPFTVYYNKTSKAITGSWCDAPLATLCAFPLGAALSTTAGYRSFAWPGSGPFGQRVITNPQRLGSTGPSGRGARLALSQSSFVRVRGLGAGGPDAAFNDPQEGWLVGSGALAGQAVVHVTQNRDPNRLQNWPVPFRRPLLSVAPQPGATTGATTAASVAVGIDGTVGRYTPGQGWTPEFLLNGDGVRQKPNLRGVAWPEASRAHAVGDGGAMWLWRQSTGLWESDPSKPLDFYGNLTSVAFQPADPSRGYAVGRQGILLRYGKTWTPEPYPDDVAGMDFTSVTFAGARAYAVWRDPNAKRSGVISNDGRGWVDDTGATAALGDAGNTALYVIAGLTDGGVVAGGDGIVIKRNSPSAPWVKTDQPPTDLSALSIAPVRDGGVLRAVIAAYSSPPANGRYPAAEVPFEVFPGDSPQLLSPVALPLTGVVMRETTGGWADEAHTQLPSGLSGSDLPATEDQVYALSLDVTGTQGWAVGGNVVRTDSDVGANDDRQAHQTAAVFRYPADPSAPAPQTGTSTISLDKPVARIAIGGHASCVASCSDAVNLGVAADVGLRSAVTAAGKLGALPGGPRAFVYTGPRVETGSLDSAEARQFADTASTSSTASGLPFYAALGPDAAGSGAAAFSAAFSAFPAPFGQGALPLNAITPAKPFGVPTPASGARNHYFFDSAGSAGTVRVVVVDNGAGSLTASDPNNVPADASQATWLAAVADDAKASHIPVVVIGNKDLDSRGGFPASTATDADTFAAFLVAHGVSAYFFDSPAINRTARVPAVADAAAQLPEFGTGTLGRGSATPTNLSAPYYGEAGYLLAEIDAAHTDQATNVASVGVRLIPVLDQLSLDPTDGVLLRRSRTALFSALGRRPRMGGADPYETFPPRVCRLVFCPGRIEPEYTFSSSRPDIANFVASDPRSSDDHAVFQDTTGKPVADSGSGLLCAFNPGTTTVTIQSGGLQYSQQLTVQGGAVGQPCGTQPLTDPPVGQQAVSDASAAAPQPAPPAATPNTGGGTISVPVSVPVPPAPPAPVPPAPAPATPAVVAPPPTLFIAPFTPPVVAPPSLVPPPTVARPLPPPGTTGVTQPVSQVEEKKEEEEATESSSAYAVARPMGEGRRIGGLSVLALLLIGAGAGSVGLQAKRRPRPRIAQARTTWKQEADRSRRNR